MTPLKYTSFVLQVWKGRKSTERDLAIMSLGLGGEAGEVLEPIKKFLRDGRTIVREELLEELGDVLYYVTRIAAWFGFTLQDVIDRNVTKLSARHPGRIQVSLQKPYTSQGNKT